MATLPSAPWTATTESLVEFESWLEWRDRDRPGHSPSPTPGALTAVRTPEG
ncbi:MULTISPECIES: hypothetical protein [unclassified Streptomyces]|uniref:hypothetical protein n=1 Tax=unclassified Streptomyces TaxID=2593676 RepID=UPI00136C24DB|nr:MULTISPECIES: hypothetical protein [unclassified Streptomyces]MEE1743742.1 hypothetical protein [Streptomyces sp. JV184]MYQ87321.1 hypothetical protein [Streptomyces sp. SID4936]